MSEALVLNRDERALTAAEIRQSVNLIQEVMSAVMKEDVHYGKIPGTKKPTLYKAGAEKLLSTFRIAVEPIVEDLSTPDEARFRVIARATAMSSSQYLGSGVGEASSAEEKYQWRRAVCVEEFEATAEDRRRLKFSSYNGKVETTQQVRTNVADIRNTVLKMAKKRAQIDVTLTVTAASDCFEQDIEDLPDELQQEITHPENESQETHAKPQPRAAATNGNGSSVRVITEKQHKFLWAMIHKSKERTGEGEDTIKSDLLSKFSIEHTNQLPAAKMDEAVEWLGGK